MKCAPFSPPSMLPLFISWPKELLRGDLTEYPRITAIHYRPLCRHCWPRTLHADPTLTIFLRCPWFKRGLLCFWRIKTSKTNSRTPYFTTTMSSRPSNANVKKISPRKKKKKERKKNVKDSSKCNNRFLHRLKVKGKRKKPARLWRICISISISPLLPTIINTKTRISSTTSTWTT